MAVHEMRIGDLRGPSKVDEVAIGGLGARRKRVEDVRFVRGKGNYLDNFKLPRMLHMQILRSPVAHARIKSIDTSRAWMTPGVHLVITWEMAAQHNLAWMPTLSYDTQAVFATDKVRFQGQEVACVVADDPYIAKDACEAIEVEYETAWKPGLENNAYYDPPNMTWPFDVYITTVEVDPDTGEWDVLKFVGVDDCGVRINPMIVEGQLHGGLTEAFAMAYHQMITFDSHGNCVGSNYMDYMIPTAWETPALRPL